MGHVSETDFYSDMRKLRLYPGDIAPGNRYVFRQMPNYSPARAVNPESTFGEFAVMVTDLRIGLYGALGRIAGKEDPDRNITLAPLDGDNKSSWPQEQSVTRTIGEDGLILGSRNLPFVQVPNGSAIGYLIHKGDAQNPLPGRFNSSLSL